MNVLLVEDDNFKKELIVKALNAEFSNAKFTYAKSVQHAVVEVQRKVFDLIVLDIALPSHDSRAGGSQPLSQPAGGVELLLELSFEDRADKVIIVTMYPEIEFNGKLYPLSSFAKIVLEELGLKIDGVVHFNALEKKWERELLEIIL